MDGSPGLKLYFCHAPLMFLGYAMLQRAANLDRVLKISLIAGIVISGLGIAQSMLGVSSGGKAPNEKKEIRSGDTRARQRDIWRRPLRVFQNECHPYGGLVRV
jgi:hypothetical protein